MDDLFGTMTVIVYDYATVVAHFRMPKMHLRTGDKLLIDFDSPSVEWLRGDWGKEAGEFYFTIHGFEGNDPAVLYSQLAMEEDLEDDDDAPQLSDEDFERMFRQADERAYKAEVARRNLNLFPLDPEQIPLF